MHPHLKAGVASTILRLPRQHREEREARDMARELLVYVGIGHAEGELARNLSYGDQRRLEIARAMALRPKVLLLDEPTAGMGHEDVGTVSKLVRSIAADRAVLMVEHNLSVVADIADRVSVLQRGRVIAAGDYATVSADAGVREAYLGTGHA